MIHSSDWVLRRQEDGKYVNKPGSANSYTKSPLRARRFPTREAALADACGNESPVPLQAILDAEYND